MGAERDGYGAVIFALFLSFILMILGFLVSIPLASMGISGLILIGLIFFLAIGFAFAKALATPILKGLGIATLGMILGGIMQTVIMFALGAGFFMMPYDGEISVAALEEVSEEVCKCGRDEGCLEEKLITLARITVAAKDMPFTEKETQSIQESTSRAQACATEPTDYVAPKKKKTSSYSASDISSTGQGSSQLKLTETDPKPLKPVYTWRKASVDELPGLVGKSVKIITIEGLDRSGKIENIEGEDVFVKKSKNFSYSVHQNMIKSIEVYEQAK